MPAGQLGRPLVHRVAEADQVEVVRGELPPLGLRQTTGVDLVDAEQHVLERGQPRQQARRLEDDAAVRARAA